MSQHRIRPLPKIKCVRNFRSAIGDNRKIVSTWMSDNKYVLIDHDDNTQLFIVNDCFDGHDNMTLAIEVEYWHNSDGMFSLSSLYGEIEKFLREEYDGTPLHKLRKLR